MQDVIIKDKSSVSCLGLVISTAYDSPLQWVIPKRQPIVDVSKHRNRLGLTPVRASGQGESVPQEGVFGIGYRYSESAGSVQC